MLSGFRDEPDCGLKVPEDGLVGHIDFLSNNLGDALFPPGGILPLQGDEFFSRFRQSDSTVPLGPSLDVVAPRPRRLPRSYRIGSVNHQLIRWRAV